MTCQKIGSFFQRRNAARGTGNEQRQISYRRQTAIGMSISGAIVAVLFLAYIWLFGWPGNRSGAISRGQFKAIRSGDSRSRVEQQLGPPEHGEIDPSALSSLSSQNPPPPGTDCIYYADNASAMMDGDVYRFCFDGAGRLVVKADFTL